MVQPRKRILLTMTAVVILIAACAPAQPTPTQEPEDTSAQVATAVALTVAAQNTQTAEAIPPATNTPLATQTPEVPPTLTPTMPTATPLAPPTATRAAGGGGTPLPRPEYACSAVNRRPFDQTVFRPNAEFDIVWTIVNTGTKTMAAGLDLKYLSGPKMTTTSRVELPELKPGEQYTVDFDAVAPNKQGLHVMTYLVDGQLCYPYVAILVER
ncbi:MAG TPA: NBR1-Ig-like domain-containing protein [Anaerolineales bacterium]|nr:NBR1-Ig-like domain-containing protein [Anaerolineales bacterium]